MKDEIFTKALIPLLAAKSIHFKKMDALDCALCAVLVAYVAAGGMRLVRKWRDG